MRIRLTNRKTGETMTVSGLPSDEIPFFAVRLGAYGILVNSIPEAGPEIPVCKCSYSGGQSLRHPDCDFHGVPARPEPGESAPSNPFAEAVFQAAVRLMQKDKEALLLERALDADLGRQIRGSR